MVAIRRSGRQDHALVNLIPRFFDVSHGGIYIDGRDLRELIAEVAAGAGRHRDAETVLLTIRSPATSRWVAACHACETEAVVRTAHARIHSGPRRAIRQD